jgi:transposase
LEDELRSDRLTSFYHEESKVLELHAIVHSYLDFTENLVRTKNRYKAFLRARGIPANGDGVNTDNKVLEKITGDYVKFTAANLFYLLGELQETKDAYGSKFSDLKTKWPAIKRLCSIPGVAAVRAATILGIVCSRRGDSRTAVQQRNQTLLRSTATEGNRSQRRQGWRSPNCRDSASSNEIKQGLRR